MNKLISTTIKFIGGLLCAIYLTTLPVNAVNRAAAQPQSGKKLPKLLDFGAEKCIACQRLAPIIKELQREYADSFTTQFIDVWIKSNLPQARKYRIQLIPTQIFLDANGKELWRHTGFISKADILKKWRELGYNFTPKGAK